MMNEKEFTSRTKIKGFTLVELLIVVGIIGIVSAIAIPNLATALQKGKQKATMGDMNTIGTAIAAYLSDIGQIPNPGEGGKIADVADCLTSYISGNSGVCNVKDFWGNDYLYAGYCPVCFQFYWGVVCPGHPLSMSFAIGSGGKGGDFTWDHSPEHYISIKMSDFEKDIIFADGAFLYGPKVKK